MKEFKCRYCGKTLPTEYQYSEWLCLECASDEDYDDGHWELDFEADLPLATAADYYMARGANNRLRAAKAKKC